MIQEPTRPRRRRTAQVYDDVNDENDENDNGGFELELPTGYAPPPREMNLSVTNVDDDIFATTIARLRVPFLSANRTIGIGEIDLLEREPNETEQAYLLRQRRADRDAYQNYLNRRRNMTELGEQMFGYALDNDPRLRERFEIIEAREISNRRADREDRRRANLQNLANMNANQAMWNAMDISAQIRNELAERQREDDGGNAPQ